MRERERERDFEYKKKEDQNENDQEFKERCLITLEKVTAGGDEKGTS